MLTKNLATNYYYSCEGDGIKTHLKLMVAAKWWLLSQLQTKLFSGKPIWRCVAALFLFIFVVLSSFGCVIFLVFGIESKAAMACLKSFTIFQ